MVGMTNAIIPERVTELRKARGLSQADLAKLVGSSQQSIDQIERGRTRRSTRLHELARALGTSPDYLLGADAGGKLPTPLVTERSVPSGHLPFGGKISAGYFLLVDEFNQDLEFFAVPDSVPIHPGYPGLQQSAWLAQGDSMNEAGILDGMWVVAASYADWVDKIGELDNGNYVIVQRTRNGGSEIERTVKEVQFARKGMRLIPRSSNKTHKEFFINLDQEANSDTEEVSILAVVLWFGRDVDPRSRK